MGSKLIYHLSSKNEFLDSKSTEGPQFENKVYLDEDYKGVN